MTAPKIVISGYYGFGNAGDEAMLSAIVRSVRALYPGASITAISGDPGKTASIFHIHAVHRFSGPAILQALWQSDLLISGGGSLLQDVTSSRSLFYYLSIIMMALFLRKKVFLYAQGIGPVHRGWPRRLLAWVLNRVSAITVRDESSKTFLASIGVASDVTVTADSVLSLPQVSLEEGKTILEEAGIDRTKGKVIGISVRSWQDGTSWAEEFHAYVKAVEEKGCQVVFIPMQYPDDAAAAECIADGTGENAHVLKRPLSVEDLMSVIGNVDLLIGVRLHALIFAALMHTPFIGISYDPKIDNFLQSIGEKAIFPISAFDGKTLYNKSRVMLHDGADKAPWEAVDAMRRRAGETVKVLARVMKE